MKSYWKRLAKAGIVVGILLLGVLVFKALTGSRKHPPRKHRGKMAMTVEVQPARAVQKAALIRGMGTVIAARSVTLLPEVSGRIVWLNPALIPGGHVKKGQVLCRIDPREYQYRLRQAEAQLVQAKAQYAREKGLKSVAEREWQLLGKQVRPTPEGRRLALHEVQLESALAQVQAAQAAVEQAQLMLERTAIRAPFDAVVTEKLAEVGQVVSPASRLATLVASDRFWVNVSIPLGQLEHISFPSGDVPGSEAEISLQSGKLEVRKKGRVLRLLGELDQRGKTARLLVEVADPLGLKSGPGTGPLLLGSFVAVDIRGKVFPGTVEVPLTAVHENSRVYVAAGDDTLQVRKVELLWTESGLAYVRGELKPGELVITSALASPVPGTKIKTFSREQGSKTESGQAPPSTADSDGKVDGAG